ncbi:MAG: hypothetical protein OHK0017_13600 [Patescibacteria group bacterium]
MSYQKIGPLKFEAFRRGDKFYTWGQVKLLKLIKNNSESEYGFKAIFECGKHQVNFIYRNSSLINESNRSFEVTSKKKGSFTTKSQFLDLSHSTSGNFHDQFYAFIELPEDGMNCIAEFRVTINDPKDKNQVKFHIDYIYPESTKRDIYPAIFFDILSDTGNIPNKTRTRIWNEWRDVLYFLPSYGYQFQENVLPTVLQVVQVIGKIEEQLQVLMLKKSGVNLNLKEDYEKYFQEHPELLQDPEFRILFQYLSWVKNYVICIFSHTFNQFLIFLRQSHPDFLQSIADQLGHEFDSVAWPKPESFKPINYNHPSIQETSVKMEKLLDYIKSLDFLDSVWVRATLAFLMFNHPNWFDRLSNYSDIESLFLDGKKEFLESSAMVPTLMAYLNRRTVITGPAYQSEKNGLIYTVDELFAENFEDGLDYNPEFKPEQDLDCLPPDFVVRLKLAGPEADQYFARFVDSIAVHIQSTQGYNENELFGEKQNQQQALKKSILDQLGLGMKNANKKINPLKEFLLHRNRSSKVSEFKIDRRSITKFKDTSKGLKQVAYEGTPLQLYVHNGEVDLVYDKVRYYLGRTRKDLKSFIEEVRQTLNLPDDKNISFVVSLGPKIVRFKF